MNKWVWVAFENDEVVACDKCKMPAAARDDHDVWASPYCPYCGSKMDNADEMQKEIDAREECEREKVRCRMDDIVQMMET